MFGFIAPKSDAIDSQSTVNPNEYDLRVALNDIRKNFGSAPRTVKRRDKIKPPFWVAFDDLKIIPQMQEKLLVEGRIVWAALVQANSSIFTPGKTNYCGNAIYVSGDTDSEYPISLLEIAGSLYDIKGEITKDPQVQVFSDTLADELDRQMKIQVPHQLTGRDDCFFTTLLFDRKHLPHRVLGGSLFPILINRNSEATLVVPCSYWPKSFIKLFFD